MKKCNKNYINAVGYDFMTNPRTKLIPVYLLFIVPIGFLPYPKPVCRIKKSNYVMWETISKYL